MSENIRYFTIGGGLALMCIGVVITSPLTAVIGIASIGVLALKD